jgi:dihydrolipoamide dehydrogenase
MKTKKYDLIAIGTGSAMNIVDAILSKNPDFKVAVIDKDEPGGICLTRACIPTKVLLYPAELIKQIWRAEEFGIDINLNRINFRKIMDRMHSLINPDIKMIKRGLSSAPNIDYYQDVAEFTEPYTLKVGKDLISSNFILLCTGSKPMIPEIKGIEHVDYHTSDTILNITELPETLAIVGGGYIAAEYGHFFGCVGSKVTIIGRNPQFLPQEEEEISEVLRREMSSYVDIITNHEVREISQLSDGKKKLIIENRETGEKNSITVDEVLIATGRAPNSDILKPEKGGIKTDRGGWIIVNEYLETSQKNIWAFGDATGRHMFKHVANYESRVVYYNAVLNKKVKVDYHAVPHAVFTYPEIASVGVGEREAVNKFGKEKIAIGFSKFGETAKGRAMNAKNYFVKVIVERETDRILGSHIIGPHASILIQEIINLMNTSEGTFHPIFEGMHIHPALSEVVEGAFYSLMSVDTYHHVIKHHLSE